jgi:hypothetical protein
MRLQRRQRLADVVVPACQWLIRPPLQQHPAPAAIAQIHQTDGGICITSGKGHLKDRAAVVAAEFGHRRRLAHMGIILSQYRDQGGYCRHIADLAQRRRRRVPHARRRLAKHRDQRFDRTRIADLPQTCPTLRQVVRWRGQLGGFSGRKGDGEPGATCCGAVGCACRTFPSPFPLCITAKMWVMDREGAENHRFYNHRFYNHRVWG